MVLSFITNGLLQVKKLKHKLDASHNIIVWEFAGNLTSITFNVKLLESALTTIGTQLRNALWDY